MSSLKKKMYITTYGCQMNTYDSHKMQDLLLPLGYEPTTVMAEAHMIILNTCHIREKAAEKTYSELGRVRDHKQAMAKRGETMLIVVAGCVAQAEGEEIFRRAPYVDIVVGPQSYHTLPRLVNEATAHGGRHLNLNFSEEAKFDLLPEEGLAQGPIAYLSIQEGCDKFCHFCVVPYTRGAEFSRPVAAVYREATRLVAQGAKEITLLGQNVTAYHGKAPEGGEWSIAKLIRLLAGIEGLERIRYTTSHPRDMQDDLIAVHGDEPKLMPFLHLPIQSGSNRILQAMNRKHTRETYFELIAKFRVARPDIGFSSDFIIGYPGETDEDFADTMDLVRAVGFASAYSFKYSPRPGTPAADKPQLPEDVKDARLAMLQALITRQQQAFNQRTIGLTLPVLFDRPGKFPGQLRGRTPYMQSLYVEASEQLLGQLVPVTLTGAYANSVSGHMATESGPSLAATA
jgi:tRNA-2-methylthio-N6-dimethylallyladenosine synthase